MTPSMETLCRGITRRYAAAQALEDSENRISTEKYETTCKLEGTSVVTSPAA
jgi:hypothetical protein